MSYPILTLRSRFNIAAEVKDADIQAAFFEADMLDIKTQLQGLAYSAIPEKYKADTAEYVGADTVLCYYAYARYQQTADQRSTATGIKLQTYQGSVILPDTSKNNRYEAMRGKADLFIVDLIDALKKDGLFTCPNAVKTGRICLIK